MFENFANSQAGPGRKAKQGQGEISRNLFSRLCTLHVTCLIKAFPINCHYICKKSVELRFQIPMAKPADLRKAFGSFRGYFVKRWPLPSHLSLYHRLSPFTDSK